MEKQVCRRSRRRMQSQGRKEKEADNKLRRGGGVEEEQWIVSIEEE